jgi:hypothetical protein
MVKLYSPRASAICQAVPEADDIVAGQFNRIWPAARNEQKTEIDKKITADRKVFHEPESITFLRN